MTDMNLNALNVLDFTTVKKQHVSSLVFCSLANYKDDVQAREEPTRATPPPPPPCAGEIAPVCTPNLLKLTNSIIKKILICKVC